MSGTDTLIENIVREVRATDWREVVERVGSEEHEDSCIWTIITDSGYFDIDVRNNHNGYYGGSVEFDETITCSSLVKEMLDNIKDE